MRGIGGDCLQFVPLPGRSVGLAVTDAWVETLPERSEPSAWRTGTAVDQRVDESRSMVIIANDPGSTGARPLPVVGAGPNFAETMKTR